MKHYIDVKMTVWHRHHFTDRANMNGLMEIVKETGLDEVLDKALGFIETETLIDTEEILNPQINKGEATIEIYDDGNEIWNNKMNP